MDVEYKINAAVTTNQFITLLKDSSLGERRPINDEQCIAGMLKNSNLIVSAWLGQALVGVARCMTDFHYACYLSDLAVSKEQQKKGIGKNLQALTQQQLGPKCKLILIAAPIANTYYEYLGFSNNSRCWMLERNVSIDATIDDASEA